MLTLRRALRWLRATARGILGFLWRFLPPRLQRYVSTVFGRLRVGDDEETPAAADSGDGECRVDATDEFYCEYDSTWEDEERQPEARAGKTWRPAPGTRYSIQTKFGRFAVAAIDMQNYRHHYPAAVDLHNDMPNLEFYLGRTPSLPDYMYIGDFHKWHENYEALESVHTYIQWLFPLQEPGVNSCARTLTKAEITEFCKSSTARANLLESYKLMLNFYGIRLRDENTGDVERAGNWRERFDNMNSHTHNSLRITRILKCLGILGFAHYQYPLVLFFLKETLKKKNLPNIKDSVLNYFVFAVLDKMQRRHLIQFAYVHYEPKDEFVWCPKNIQMKHLRTHEHGRDLGDDN